MPTKEQLKAQYNISNDDFEVLTERPPDEEIQKKGFLIKLAEAIGVQPWMNTKSTGSRSTHKIYNHRRPTNR